MSDSQKPQNPTWGELLQRDAMVAYPARRVYALREALLDLPVIPAGMTSRTWEPLRDALITEAVVVQTGPAPVLPAPPQPPVIDEDD